MAKYILFFGMLLFSLIISGMVAGSTTIQLKTPDTENLEDDDVAASGGATSCYIDDPTDGGASYGYAYIKFTLTTIPANQVIDDAQVYILTENVNNFDADDEIVVYCVDDQTWNEHTGSDTDMIDVHGTANQTITGMTGTDTWYNFTVTSCVAYEYERGNDNVTFGWLPNDDADSADDYTWFSSKEFADDAARPYLNITYSSAAPSDTCTPPASGDWYVKAQDNCTLSDNTVVTGMFFLSEGPGNFTLDGASLAVETFKMNATASKFYMPVSSKLNITG